MLWRRGGYTFCVSPLFNPCSRGRAWCSVRYFSVWLHFFTLLTHTVTQMRKDPNFSLRSVLGMILSLAIGFVMLANSGYTSSAFNKSRRTEKTCSVTSVSCFARYLHSSENRIASLSSSSRRSDFEIYSEVPYRWRSECLLVFEAFHLEIF